MTMPDRITITHQEPMSTPTIRAALDTFQQAANRGTAVYLSSELVQESRDALQAEPEGAAEALAARPLLERVARLGDVIGQQIVDQVVRLAGHADAWLRSNPPGQPVKIKPQGCPTPGACSCVEPTSPTLSGNYIDPEHTGQDRELLQAFYRACAAEGGTADEIHLRGIKAVLGLRCAPPAPEPGEVGEVLSDQALEALEAEFEAWHQRNYGWAPGGILMATSVEWGSHLLSRPSAATLPALEQGEVATLVAALSDPCISPLLKERTRAATLLQQQAAELAALRGVPVAVSERLRIMTAGLRLGYMAGHNDTVEGTYADPDEFAADYAPEVLGEMDGLSPLPAPQAGEGE